MFCHRLLARIHIIILVIFFLLCFSCTQCRGRNHRKPNFCESPTSEKPLSFLWSIRREPPAFLFGTIHVPYSRVWDHIPENTKRAFEASESVFFELDLTDPSTISALTHCQLLPAGERLSDILPRDLYRRLQRHLDYVKSALPSWMTAEQRGRGLYADYLFNALTGNWERKRPVWVMLMVNALTESDVKARGIPVLDLYLAQEAERMSKPTGAVERVDEQCLPLNGLNGSQVLFALNQTLNQHESLRAGDGHVLYTTDDLIKHYNCGDLNAVIFNQDTAQVPNLLNASLPMTEQRMAHRIDAYFRQELIYKRNERMGERVIELLVAHPDRSFFFAFGAGHFLGNNTVLDVLKKGGFLIDNIPANRKIKPLKKKSRGSVGLLPEFQILRDFTSNSLSEPLPEARSYVQFTRSPSERTHKMMIPPRLVSATPSRKHRNFNDLWVRLDPSSTGAPRSLPQSTAQDEDELIVQQSLRIWYGLPTNSAVILFSWRTIYFVTLLSVVASSCNQIQFFLFALTTS